MGLALVGALGLAVWGTWPLAAHLGTHVYDPPAHEGVFWWNRAADARLCLWILAWPAHALLTAPSSLLGGNIFHPFPRSLLLSEHTLGALPFYLPFFVLSGDPVLAQQGMILVTFVCAFLAALLLAWEWTGSWPAAVVAGTLFAFSSFRLRQLDVVMTLGNFYLPLLALLARRTLLDVHRWRWPVLLTAALALQTLHFYYLGFTAFLMVLVLGGSGVMGDPAARPQWRRLGCAITGGGILVTLLSLPYIHLWRSGVIPAGAPDVLRLLSASPGQTGSTPALALALASAPLWVRGLAPGVTRTWIWALVAVALVSHLVALGPEIRFGARVFPGPYALAAALVPPLSAMRGTVRFNAPVTMATAVLAALGVAGAIRWLEPRLGHRAMGPFGWCAAGAVSLGVLAFAPTVRVAPIEKRADIPPVYHWLSSAPTGPVLELPLGGRGMPAFAASEETRRMYRSIYHWQPLLNGYSSIIPPTYSVVTALAAALPDARALELLARATGVRYLVLHRDQLSRAERRRWRRRTNAATLRVTAVFGADVVFSVTPRPADLMPALLDTGRSSTTLLGTPLLPLREADRRAALVLLRGPRRLAAGSLDEVEVAVTNRSHATWPALAPVGPYTVTIASRWVDGRGRPLAASVPVVRLPYDLAPGETVRVTVPLAAPPAGFVGEVAVGVVQGTTWFEPQLPLRPSGMLPQPG